MLTVRYGLLALLLNLILSCHKPITPMPSQTLLISSPSPYQILQRDKNNTALVPIDVKAEYGTAYATFEPIEGGIAIVNLKIGTIANGRVRGAVALTGGDYKLTITLKDGETVVGSQTVDRVGVGEVIVIWGHSVASGLPTPIYDNPDARVRIANYADPNLDQTKLPDTFSPLTATSSIGPFGSGPYAWGPFGNKLVKSLNVPVLLFNTAFGGSQLLQSWKVINHIPFEHSFVKYDKGMPYEPLKAALSKYIPKTGCRAILVHHGGNDRNDVTREQFRDYYRTVIQYTRSTFGLGNEMPWLLAIEDGGVMVDPIEHVRLATTDVISVEPNVYKGADLLDLRAKRTGRDDTMHLLPEDWDAYATLWANALLPLIGKTKPLSAQLSSDYPVVNGGFIKLDTLKQYLPDTQSALLAVSIGAVVALFVARKPIPALIALCLAMFGLGRKLENKVLNANKTTQVG